MIEKLADKPRLTMMTLLGGYIIFSEAIKVGAEVYIVEQSLEIKLLLFSLAVVLMYEVPTSVIIFGSILLLLLFGVEAGFMVYVFIFYAFTKLVKVAKSA